MTERLILMAISALFGALLGALLMHGAHLIKESNDDERNPYRQHDG